MGGKGTCCPDGGIYLVLSSRSARVLVVSLCAAFVVSSCFVAAADAPSSEGPEAEAASLEQGMRTVDCRWYDFFAVPLGDWWDKRWEVYGTDYALTSSFPYLVRHYHDLWDFETFSGARLNITGRDLPEVNTLDSPQFLPFLSGYDGPRGGEARIAWYMQYMSPADYPEYPLSVPDYDDGFLVILNGTVTFDMDAAMTFLGMTSDAWSDFDAWWTSNAAQTENDYIDWLQAEGNSDRLDIFTMYDFPMTVLQLQLDAVKAGDEIVLSYDCLSWGMEALMARWMRESLMPTEWWFEDMRFNALMGPEHTDLDVDTAVSYAVKAWETEGSGAPCWIWQGMLQDRIESTPAHPESDFDPYGLREHVSRSPGSPSYGEMVGYRYTPGCSNLSAGETLTLTWPDDPITFLAHDSEWVATNITSAARVVCAEPMPVEAPDSVTIDPVARTVEFVGPIDFWTWSKAQDDHENLSAEWDRLGILPWGMPCIEMSVAGENSPPFAYLSAEHDPDANVSSAYILDAGLSSDADDDASELQYRWDLDGDGGWDIDWGVATEASCDFCTLGVHTAVVEVMDTDGASDSSAVEVSITDIDRPETVASFTGLAGQGGWFVSDVVVTLSATDSSLIDSTWCNLDGAGWAEYLGAIDVTSDGVHTVEYYSVDGVCNVEDVCGDEFGIDRVAPAVSFISSSETYVTSDVTIIWSRSDGLSGVNRSELSLDGSRYIPFGGDTSHTFTEMVDGVHTVFVRVYDNAGNAASDSYTFTVDAADDDGGGTTEPPGDDDNTLLYLGVVVGAVAAVLVVMFLLARRVRSKVG